MAHLDPGRADQIVKWSGKVWGRDFKTSSKDGAFYQRQLDPNEQFTGYTYAEGKFVKRNTRATC